eukprot:scaffold23642_cov101-Isochrysis_galbana.AAC.1
MAGLGSGKKGCLRMRSPSAAAPLDGQHGHPSQRRRQPGALATQSRALATQPGAFAPVPRHALGRCSPRLPATVPLRPPITHRSPSPPSSSSPTLRPTCLLFPTSLASFPMNSLLY